MRTLALLALCAVAAVAAPSGSTDPSKKAPKKNRIAESLVMARHSDPWCHKHHMGAGQGPCTRHPGCCYSKLVDKQFKKLQAKNRIAPNVMIEANLTKYGPCHSCDHHDHGWCKFYGSVSTSHCIKLSMCTWKVATKEGEKGHCESKITPLDFGGAIDDQRKCNQNMGNTETATFAKQNYEPDKDYVTWKKCVEDSKKSTDGGKCFDTKELRAGVEKKSNPIPGGQKWFPKKELCESYADCKKATTGKPGRRWNRLSDPRCPDGSKFKWEMPSQRPTLVKEGGKMVKKANTRLGTNKDGCRELYSYKARCVMNGGKPTEEYAPYQADEDKLGFDGYFCVDKDGHEIPDTRKKRPVELFDINCVIQRQKHEGQQCPNAVTLTTRGGGVVVNKRNGKKRDCVVHCNSDTDCTKGNKWCCYNGCGYKCMTPLKEPLAGCQQPPGADLIEARRWVLVTPKGKAHNGKGRHGISLTAKCNSAPSTGPSFTQVPTKKTGPNPIQSLELKCQHGSWVHCPPGQDCIRENEFKKLLQCKQDCPLFILATETVNGVQLTRTVQPARSGKDLYQDTREARARDILVSKRTGFKSSAGDVNWLRHHGATRTITCPPGYGAVQHAAYLGKSKLKSEKRVKSAASLSIVRHGYEVLTCGKPQEGVWQMRTLECSVCYDAYEWQWRDKKGNSCAYYRSRPLKCHDIAEQTVARFADTNSDNVFCGTYSAEWAQYGMHLLKRGQIGMRVYREFYQPWGDVPLFSQAPYKNDPIMKADPTFAKKDRAGAKTINAQRPCVCIPDEQPGFYLVNKQPTASSPPNVCGQMIPGKKVFVNPNTGKKFVKNGKDENGIVYEKGYFVAPKISYGNAVDACRVSCRSCEQAENRFLQRTRFSKEVFQAKLKKLANGNWKNEKFAKNVGKKYGGADAGEGKWRLVKRKVLEWVKHVKKQTVTKIHSKSYPVSQVCTDGKGTNFLKCGVISPDPREICKPKNAAQINPTTKCKKGFEPMATPAASS